jgi:PAS domain S-box-containing protein
MSTDPIITPLSDTGDVIDAWNDLVLFVDAAGLVAAVDGLPPSYLVESVRCGVSFWIALCLDADSLAETLERYQPMRIHEVPGSGGRSFLLRIIPLDRAVAEQGGFVIVATDNRPMETLYETYEERLEDNISALSDSVTLFNALFDTAKDATFLINPEGIILSANAAAGVRLGLPARDLSGSDVETVLAGDSRAVMHQAIRSLDRGGVWSGTVAGDNGLGGSFPAEATLRHIRFTGYSLFQLILHDMSSQVELREDLRDQKAEVENMNVALKRVIKTVEEDRREMREALTRQVRRQMLPALDRIARAETADVREGYRAVIEERLADLAGEGDSRQDAALFHLSPREMEVCQLVQLGRTGNEIAELLNMSFETVQTHRKNIRKKLGLRGKRTSLHAYLRQKPPLC